MAWVYVAATVALTVYGQLMVKWRILRYGHVHQGFHAKASLLTSMLLDPWVLSAFLAAFLAALAWMAALSRLELSRAYPVMGTSFVLILIFSRVLFGEALSTEKIAGVVLVVGGIVVATSF